MRYQENMMMTMINKIIKRAVFGLCVSTLLAAPLAVASTLERVDYTSLSNGQGQLQLEFSGPAPEPSSFTTTNPSRLAIDLPDTKLAVDKKAFSFDSGIARHIRLIEAGERTRVVISLVKSAPYEIRQERNFIFINLSSASAPLGVTSEVATGGGVDSATDSQKSRVVENIDFRRGDEGEGKIVIKLSDPETVIDMQQKGEKIIVDLYATRLPERLERRLDVADFATPVTTIDSFKSELGVRLVITPSGNYEHLAYQADDTYTIDVKAISKAEEERIKKEKFGYTGEKLSLNFQNIEVRAVLQLVADFTGMNVVASDTVQGNITLRLKNVPWDQALDIILKTRGLGMRQSGNVLLIAPNEELAAREKQELEAMKQVEELAPLRTEFYQVNYAKASEVAMLLKGEGNSLLSERGNVSIDERTNVLMVLDTGEKLEEIGRLVTRLDVPIKQVLIETRIVIANDDFTKELGIRSGLTAVRKNGSSGFVGTSGTYGSTDSMVSSGLDNVSTTGSPFPVAIPTGGTQRLNVNLPVISPTGSIALAVLGGDYLVDLELSAMQKEGEGEVISNPRVVTSNQMEASIEQGVEIPYQEASSSGATSVSFKKAVLALTVTPQITPDDRVVMDLDISKDSVGDIVGGIPSINTRNIKTQVLVNNGDTVVLGGIYEQEWYDQTDKVPFLGDIPVLGYLFKTNRTKNDKRELLIFVTPKILKEGMLATF